MKEKILKIITDYYLNSGDFNGLPLYYFDKNGSVNNFVGLNLNAPS